MSVKVINTKHGPFIEISVGSLGYNGFEASIIPETLTPHEAEKLLKELTDAIRSARNVLNSKVRI